MRGRTEIQVDIVAGGQKLIRIRDNGSGIPKDELGLALSRHATSKISSLDDLEAVVSLGFRGEALPSIASVSRMTICSRERDADTAWQLEADNGAISEPRPAAHPVGTTIEVHDLFYNTPARRRFLKTERTEFGHIEKWIKRLALSRPDVALTMTHNRRTVLQLNAADSDEGRLHRLGKILGETFAQNAVHIESETDGIAVVRLALSADVQSQSTRYAILVREWSQYQRQDAGARCPTCLPGCPVSRSLSRLCHQPDDGSGDGRCERAPGQTRSPVSRWAQGSRRRVSGAGNRAARNTAWWACAGADRDTSISHSFEQSCDALARVVAFPPRAVAESLAAYQAMTPAASAAAAGQVTFRRWVLRSHNWRAPTCLAENSDGLIVVDMHAAHERILYEKLKKNFDNNEVVRQPLLVPTTVSVAESEADLVAASDRVFRERSD